MMTVQKVSVTAKPRGNKIATRSGEGGITTRVPMSWLTNDLEMFRQVSVLVCEAWSTKQTRSFGCIDTSTGPDFSGVSLVTGWPKPGRHVRLPLDEGTPKKAG